MVSAIEPGVKSISLWRYSIGIPLIHSSLMFNNMHKLC
jgi:hypothetical protein